MSTETESQLGSIVARMGLKTLVESCLVLEEGVASAKDIEIGMMMGAGILPGPFTRADEAGLDAILDGLEHAEREWGPAFEPPTVLRRLVAQGRLGKKSGQGFFPYPQPDAGDQRETVLLETRGDVAIAWLNRPPANPLSPQAVRDLISAVGRGRRQGAGARARVLEHLHVQRRRRHQGVHQDDARRRGRRPRRGGSPLHARDGAVLDGDDRGGQLDRVRRRLRAGDGVRLPHRRRVGHVRPARDQPRPHPRLRRDPAAAASGGRGEGARDEPRRRPDRRLRGAPRRAREPGRPRPRAVRHGDGLGTADGGEGADRGRGDQEALAPAGPRRGAATEAEGFARAFGSEDAKEGIGAFLGKRRPEFKGR